LTVKAKRIVSAFVVVFAMTTALFALSGVVAASSASAAPCEEYYGEQPKIGCGDYVPSCEPGYHPSGQECVQDEAPNPQPTPPPASPAAPTPPPAPAPPAFIPPGDACPNIAADQNSVPNGYVVTSTGQCVEAPDSSIAAGIPVVADESEEPVPHIVVGGGELPFTGSVTPVGWAAIAGGIFLLLGAGMNLIARRASRMRATR
jgi:hypothetical protein